MRRAGLAAAGASRAPRLAGRGELPARRPARRGRRGRAARPLRGARQRRASVELHHQRLWNSTLDRISARGWERRVAAARRYAATRPGAIAFAVRTPTRIHGVGIDRVFVSTSVVKAMLLVAYTRGARDRPLRADERALLAPMIRASDNDAANALFVRVGTAGLTSLARAAGMTRFAPATPIWGNSQITARDQTRFFLRLDRLLPKRHRAYALSLLRTVVPSQRWGIGRAPPARLARALQGRLGLGHRPVDHQVALLTRGDERLAVAVLTAGNGTHAVGKQTLEGVFRRLLAGLG